MTDDLFKYYRKSHIQKGEIYFWTATINKWQKLLMNNQFKDVIINSLEYLSNSGKIDVFAFVIMPNHIHLIWRINENNGLETTQSSFLKYTAHEFKKMLKNNASELSKFAINAGNKKFEFWKKDSLAIHLYSQKVAYQKLNYIHLNPLAEHWQLATDPSDYYYSSAKYYECGIKEFSFLKDLREEF